MAGSVREPFEVRRSDDSRAIVAIDRSADLREQDLLRRADIVESDGRNPRELPLIERKHGRYLNGEDQPPARDLPKCQVLHVALLPQSRHH